MDKVYLEWRQKKTKRIIGDTAENSTASLVQVKTHEGMFEITLGTHFKWKHAGDGHAAKVAEEGGPASAEPQHTFQRHSSKRTHQNPVPTRETSLRTGCSVGSSIIRPAATMGIMAVKILVREVQIDTEKIKTGRHENKHTAHRDQLKGLLMVDVMGGTVYPPAPKLMAKS